MAQPLRERSEPVGLLDALTDTEEWLSWTHGFGPLSGFAAKVGEPRRR